MDLSAGNSLQSVFLAPPWYPQARTYHPDPSSSLHKFLIGSPCRQGSRGSHPASKGEVTTSHHACKTEETCSLSTVLCFDQVFAKEDSKVISSHLSFLSSNLPACLAACLSFLSLSFLASHFHVHIVVTVPLDMLFICICLSFFFPPVSVFPVISLHKRARFVCLPWRTFQWLFIDFFLRHFFINFFLDNLVPSCFIARRLSDLD